MKKVFSKFLWAWILLGIGACSPSGTPENRRGQSGAGDPVATIDDTGGGATDADQASGNTDSSPDDASSDPCGANLIGREDIPAPSQDRSHIVFSLNQNNVDPCSVGGFIVGQQDKEVVNAGGGVYYIPDVPAGSYDVILQANGAPLESPDASNPSDIAGANLAQIAQKFGLRVNRVVAQANQVTELDPTETFLRKVGSVTGVANLESQTDHTGILVAIPGTHWNAITDADGTYTIPEVVPGVHDFSFFKDQYIPGRIGEATVEADTQLVLPQITLVLNTGESAPLIASAADQPSDDLRLDFAIQTTASPIKMKVSLDSSCANQAFVPFASSASITIPATEGIRTTGYDTVDVFVCIIDRDNTPSTLSKSFLIDIFGLVGAPPTFDTPATLTTQYGPTAIVSNVSPQSEEFAVVGFRVNDPVFEGAAIFDPDSYGKVEGESTGYIKIDLGSGDEVCGDNVVYIRLVNPDGFMSSVAKQQVDYQCWQTLVDENFPNPHETDTVRAFGDRLMVFGDGVYSQYRLDQGTWSDLPVTDRPSSRRYPWVFWTGSSFVVFGGVNPAGSPSHWYDGGIYQPETDTWQTITSLDGSVSDLNQAGRKALWLGDRLFIWGGNKINTSDQNNTGAVYIPATDTWYATSTENAPVGRESYTPIWTGSRVIVWGGVDNANNELNTGAIYDPYANTWTPIPTTGGPVARTNYAAVWTGDALLIHGGEDASWNYLADAFLLTNIEVNPTWTQLPDALHGGHRNFDFAGRIAGEFIFFDPNDKVDYGAHLNAALDTWVALEDSCADFPGWSGVGATSRFLVTWPAICGQSVYDPATKAWRSLPAVGQPGNSGSGYFSINALSQQIFVQKLHYSSYIASTIYLEPEPIRIAWGKPNDREYSLVYADEAVELGLRVVNGPIAQASANLSIKAIRGPATIGQNNLALGALAANQIVDVPADGSLAILVNDNAKAGDLIEVDVGYDLPFGISGAQTLTFTVRQEPKPSLIGVTFDNVIGPELGGTVNTTLSLANRYSDTITLTSITRGNEACITSFGDPGVQTLNLGETYQTTVALTASADAACEGNINLGFDIAYTDSFGVARTATVSHDFAIGAVSESQSDTTSEPIPDNDPTGLTKTLAFSTTGTAGGVQGVSGINLRVQVDHDYGPNLRLYLIAPDTTEVEVIEFPNDFSDSYNLTFTEETHASLVPLLGKSINGTWSVKIVDSSGGSTGDWNLVELSLSGFP